MERYSSARSASIRAELSACWRASSRSALYWPTAKNTTAVTRVRVVARRRRRTAIEGSTVSEPAAVEWIRGSRTVPSSAAKPLRGGRSLQLCDPLMRGAFSLGSSVEFYIGWGGRQLHCSSAFSDGQTRQKWLMFSFVRSAEN